MYAQQLIEVFCAAHLACRVDSPFPERGGIMLVGPPAALKSTFLEQLEAHYHDALTLTDLNAKAMAALRDRLATETIRTLVFPEFAKIYERKDDTSSNLEGALRALVAEGFAGAAFEPQGINRIRARGMVIGGITPETQVRRYERWEGSGFNRRFQWPVIRLADPGVLDEAVYNWKRIDFRVQHVPQPEAGSKIPNLTTRDEREHLKTLVRFQPGGSTTQQHQLLVKILAVLKWWYDRTENPTNPMDTVNAYGKALGKEGVTVELMPPSSGVRRRVVAKERERKVHEAAQTLARRAVKVRQPRRHK